MIAVRALYKKRFTSNASSSALCAAFVRRVLNLYVSNDFTIEIAL